MKCPYCGEGDTRVLDSRQTEEGRVVRRRRVCAKCGKRFTTYETAEASIVMIKKKDGRLEQFDRGKIRRGLLRACEKRPVPMETIEQITDEIEQKVYALGEKEVPSTYIGQLVMDALRSVDQVAYIRFASVYREFPDVEKFAEEIDKLRKQSASQSGAVSSKADAEKASSVQIAVDGPSGAGKSTVAKIVASRLGYDYIDTGAMYRAVAYKTVRDHVRTDDRAKLQEMLADTEIDLDGARVLLDGEDVSGKIRTPEISEAASRCAQIPEVRAKLVELQREIGRRKNVVMDGRDIGTNVFPDAPYKFFLTASPEERAMRRFRELHEKDPSVVYEEVLRDVKARDHRDTHRKTDPLRRADDAVEIDSTSMTAEEAAQKILDEVRGRV